VTASEMRGGSRPPSRLSIESYYDETWLDYRLLWLGKQSMALHFGYHDSTTRGHADALLNTNRILANRGRVDRGARVLDAGCGVGGSSLWLARSCGARVVGVALGRAQIVHAHKLASRRHFTRPPVFLQADYTATPFHDASFDVVWALESLCHADNKAAFYREAARLLRPGGRLVVAEFMRTARPLFPDEDLIRQWLDGWAIPDLDTPHEHERHAAAAGFTDVTLEDVTPLARRSLRRLYRMAFLTYPLALTARCLRLRSSVQHGNVVAAIRQYDALRLGQWLYGLLSATKADSDRR